MNQLLLTTRAYDFKAFYRLYLLGQESQSYFQLFYFFARYGVVFVFLSFAYLIWVRKINAFLCSFLAMGIAGLVDLITFAIWKRPFPFVTYSELVNVNTYGMRMESSSFPSCHTYIAFAVATSVFLYGHKKLGPVLMVLAIFLAIGRIGVGLHYPSDVIGGALLGIGSGIIAYILTNTWQRHWIAAGS